MLLLLLIAIRVVLDLFYFLNKRPPTYLHLAYFFLYLTAAALMLLIDGLNMWAVLSLAISAYSLLQFLSMRNKKIDEIAGH
ncbi:hypothetical protein [Undibacterium umbellatum]|uniref:Uncharacterized protein n=1 Tax=Undibacterium umbellatum TaxID=2762300 RepID=A0ABR6ZAS5_9BURK|nr:hypothetical protein [Undibacterium umbellatum]MBC3908681.1 hypothetical protein [Undibacterium umbellatum]